MITDLIVTAFVLEHVEMVPCSSFFSHQTHNPTFPHIKTDIVAQYSCITIVDRFDSIYPLIQVQIWLIIGTHSFALCQMTGKQMKFFSC